MARISRLSRRITPPSGTKPSSFTPQDLVRSSPGFDFTGKTSREAAAELQPAAPPGLRHSRTGNPSAYARGYFLAPFRGLGNSPVSSTAGAIEDFSCSPSLGFRFQTFATQRLR